MDISFNINRLALIGLGATLTSLIMHCSNSLEIKFWFLCSDLRKADKSTINALLQSAQFQGTVEFIDFDAKATFGHLPPLHGDWTAYGRLLIPSHINTTRCLYLDADILVLLDILDIKNFLFEGRVLAAVYGCSIDDSLDGQFFINELGWTQKQPYFNSGVLFFNCQLWRERNMDGQWTDLASRYGQNLISHDQTLLNALCKGVFTPLPPSFNVEWTPATKTPPRPEGSILHFVGSPKPWDFGGKRLHKGYDIWLTYNKLHWGTTYGGLTSQRMLRQWRIKESILRTLFRKIGI